MTDNMYMGTIRQDKKRQQQSDLDKKQNKEQSKSKAREENTRG